MTTVNPYAPPNPQPEDDPPLVAQLAIEGEGMTVEFEQTLEDLVSMAEFHSRKASGSGRQVVILVGVLVIISGVLLTVLLNRARNFGAMLPMFFAAAFFLALLLVLTLL